MRFIAITSWHGIYNVRLECNARPEWARSFSSLSQPSWNAQR